MQPSGSSHQPLKHSRTPSQLSHQSHRSGAAGSGKHVGAWGLALLTFFNVSGGPWGSEPIVSACGPLPGFIMLLTMALLWGLPISLVTSELSSALPGNGGYVLWVDTAFGGFWGFQESFWSWGSCVVDNALYPVLAYETFQAMYKGAVTQPLSHGDEGENWWTAYFAKLALTLLFSAPVLFGKTEWVTKGMAVMVVLLLLPFCVLLPMVLWSGHLNWSLVLASRPAKQLDLVYLLHVAFWNFNGFDCASTCAGEVHDPGRAYPRGLLSALVVVVLVTALPLLVATARDVPPWQLWEVGWWSAIANQQAGYGMASWVVFSSLIGTFGMHAAVMWEDAWQLCGMAEQGLAPKWLAGRNKDLGTPENATILSMSVVCALIMFDFRAMVIIDNFFSVASGLLELAAFYQLRVHRPDLPRPFSVPWIGHEPWRVAAFLFLPGGLGLLVLLTSFDDGWSSVFMLVPFLVVGFIIPHFVPRRLVLPPSVSTAEGALGAIPRTPSTSQGYGSMLELARAAGSEVRPPFRMRYPASSSELDAAQADAGQLDGLLDAQQRPVRIGSIFTPADELIEQMEERELLAEAEELEEEEREAAEAAEADEEDGGNGHLNGVVEGKEERMSYADVD